MLGKLIPEGIHSSHQPFDDPNTRNLVKEVSLKVGWKGRDNMGEANWRWQATAMEILYNIQNRRGVSLTIALTHGLEKIKVHLTSYL